MINILVADDSIEKQQQIKKTLDEYFSSGKDVCIEYVQDVVNAKNIMSKKNVDILLLDLYLPIAYENGADKNGGISLIKQINKSIKYKCPEYVISLSQHKDAMKEFEKTTEKIYKAILYDATSMKWSNELKKTLDYIIPNLENNVKQRHYQYDIAVVCALGEELDQVKRILSELKQISVPFDDQIYFGGLMEGNDKKIRVVIANAFQMGMVATSALTTNMIQNFIPRYVVMTGIAAGIKKYTNMGDTVVAEFTWDYGAGKEIVDKNGFHRHLNTIKPIDTDSTILAKVKQLQQDKKFLSDIGESFNGKVPDTKFKIVIGPMATGAAVIADPEKVEYIIDRQMRNVVAIEMEAYGMYYAANWAIQPKPKFLAVKSICDYADEKKDDDFHEYASYTSVKVFEKLAKEYFEY